MLTKECGIPSQIVGWIHNHAKKNLWRVAAWYEIDDLIQDGLMIALKCRDHYGDVEPKHYMRLVQTSFYNHMGQLIRKKRAVDDSCTKISDMDRTKSEETILERLIPGDYSPQELVVLIGDLPENLFTALSLFFTDEGCNKLCRTRQRLYQEPETEDHKLARLTGFANFELELRNHFV